LWLIHGGANGIIVREVSFVVSVASAVTASSVDPAPREEPHVVLKDVSCAFGSVRALRSVDVEFLPRSVTAIVGPTGSGKSTLLRVLNRQLDGDDRATVTGQVLLGGLDVYGADVDVFALRRRVALVLRSPAVFAMSVFDNVAFGLRAQRKHDAHSVTRAVESALRRADLWDSLKDQLDRDARALSLSQQMLLCLARSLALEPEVLLLDEPTLELDPSATGQVEDVLAELRKSMTIVVVTQLMAQAARVSQHLAFFEKGALVECGETRAMFTRPKDKRAQDFLSGRYRP
jgi:phosphate transport system ATP-binding protein